MHLAMGDELRDRTKQPARCMVLDPFHSLRYTKRIKPPGKSFGCQGNIDGGHLSKTVGAGYLVDRVRYCAGPQGSISFVVPDWGAIRLDGRCRAL